MSVGTTFTNSTDFLDYFIKDYQIESERRSITDPMEFKSNKNMHTQVELTFSVEENDLYMVVTVIETKTHFYKILCWTLLEYKNQFRDDYLKISKSLKD